ncbi:MAG: hypothetical protein IT343_24645 [Candidatus Melainabacteria bacterium]|nr:hypothetical protein [Candidatus Melainabacteria bacterium]
MRNELQHEVQRQGKQLEKISSWLASTGKTAMVTQDSTEQVLWMADCYSLAKRFPNPHTWLSLLQPDGPTDANEINPFHYWLWMEIWKAAQTEQNAA